MNLHTARSNVLRKIHTLWLKEMGFVMRSRRSEWHYGPMHRAVAVISFDTNTTDWVEFDVTLCAAHDEYNPFKANGLKSGFAHKDVQLISIGLAQLSDSALRAWSLRSDVDVEVVLHKVMLAFQWVWAPTFGTHQ